MNTPKVTPKDFVLWLGAMVALYGGVFAFISLIFDYINHAFPNPVTNSYYYDVYASSSISFQTATLIVMTPVFMILMRLIRRDIARDPSRSEIWVRRWALYLTLFLAGLGMVIDLIVLVNTFLQGEDLTAGFLLKVLTVLLVAAVGFMHFLADLRGYWEKQQARARLVNWAVGALVVISIVAGFFIIGTPQQIRAQKQDAIRVQDLQNIQWQVVNYWQQKESLPSRIEELNDPLAGWSLPKDPQTGADYLYTRQSPLDFTLCAAFNGAAAPYSNDSMVRPMEPGMNDNWQHGAGEQCFDRSIDPERYPPFNKNK